MNNHSSPYVLQVFPYEGVSLQAHANMLLANELSLETFEESLMSFIEGLLDAHPKPLYTQLELGKVIGLSRKETRAIRKVVGIE